MQITVSFVLEADDLGILWCSLVFRKRW